MSAFTKSRWIFSLLAAQSLSGCAGIYAEAGLSVLPSTTFSSSSHAIADQASASSFATTSVATVGFGADFDIARRYRLTVGYENDNQAFSEHAQSNFGGGAARFDATLGHISERLKVRGSVGFSLGQGIGIVSVPGAAGTQLSLPASQVEGGSGVIGVGLTYYALPFLALHLMLGPDVVGSKVPGGSEIGVGGTARIAASLYFGDSRPDSTVREPMKSHLNVMPAIAAGARHLGCRAVNVVHGDFAGLEVKCPGEGEARFSQTADAVIIMCPHTEEHACRRKLDDLLGALAPKAAKKMDAPPPPPPPPPAP